jgi:outer membrane lipoprotein-sorting protein
VTDVEPIVKSELDRLLPIPEVAPKWSDVERRSRRIRRKAPRHLLAFAAIAVATAVAVLLAISLRGNGTPSIVSKAYAAINGRSGVMHFVVTYPESGGRRPYYEEYWFDLAHPSRQRIVQSAGGKVFHQLVYVGGYRKIVSLPGGGRNPLTVIMHAPPPAEADSGADPNARGVNPILGYRQLLRSGRVLSESEIDYHGKRAYRLVIFHGYVAGDPRLGTSRITYIVNKHTYYPLEYRVVDNTFGTVSVTRYLEFEILPATPAAEALLQPVPRPRPYKP